jgi:hypothetical protein
MTSEQEALGLRCPARPVRPPGAVCLLAAVLPTVTSEQEASGLRCPASLSIGADADEALLFAAGAPGSPPPRQWPAVASLPPPPNTAPTVAARPRRQSTVAGARPTDARRAGAT